MISPACLILLVVPFCLAQIPAQTQNPSRPLRFEIGLFVDSELFDAYVANFKVDPSSVKEIFKTTVLTNYLYGLNKVYSDKSIGDLHLQVAITHFEIVPESTWKTWNSIYSFCEYQKTKSSLKLDASVLMMFQSGQLPGAIKMKYSAGRGLTATLGSDNHCAVIKESPRLNLANTRLIAHELGHVIGLTDQGFQLLRKLKSRPDLEGTYPYDDMRCKVQNLKAVMAGSANTWCKCSQRNLKIIMSSDRSKVLETVGNPGIPLNQWAAGTFGDNIIPLTREDLCNGFKEKSSEAIEYKKVADPPACKFAEGECLRIINPVSGWPRQYLGGAKIVTGYKCNGGYCFEGECLTGKQLSDKMSALNKPTVKSA